MSKPLPTQNTFAGIAPPWSLTQLDANFTNVWGAINDVGTYSNVFTDTGTVNALVVTPAAGVTMTLTTGLTMDVIVGNTTTSGGPTLNANGSGAKTIIGAAGTSLPLAALVAGGIYRVVYDGTNWRLTSPTASSVTAVKLATTTRTSAPTQANDPDLVIALAGAGTYAFEVFFTCWNTASGGAGSLSGNINYSGTFTANPVSNVAGWFGLTAASGQFVIPSALQSSPTGVGFGIPGISAGGTANASIVSLKGTLTATAAGVIGLSWAQNVSNTVGLNVGVGSWFKVDRFA